MTKEEIISFAPPTPDLPLAVWLAGISYCDGNYQMSRRNSKISVIEYICRGKGVLEVNGKHFYPQAGDVYIVPENTIHHYRADAGDPWIKIWFNISGPLVLPLLSGLGLSGINHIPDCPVKTVFENALTTLKNAPEKVNITGAQEIFRVLMAISTVFRSKRNIPVSNKSESIREYLDRFICRKPPSVEMLCRHANYSQAQLYRIFKRDFGMSCLQYLMNKKIDTAKIMLRNSVKPVKEIAAELGFDDEYYFSNFFHKHCGYSPSNYRKKT